MSSAASAIDAPPLCLNRSPTCRAASGPGRRRGGRSGRDAGRCRLRGRGPNAPPRLRLRSLGERVGQRLGAPEAHGGESDLDDGGFVDLRRCGRPGCPCRRGSGSASSRSALRDLRGRTTRGACRRAWHLGAARVLHLLLGLRLGRRPLGLAAALGLGEQRLLLLALLHQAADLGRVLLGQRLPVDAATSDRQRPGGRPGRSCATTPPPARPWRWRPAPRASPPRAPRRHCGFFSARSRGAAARTCAARGAARPAPRPSAPCPRRPRNRGPRRLAPSSASELRRAGPGSLCGHRATVAFLRAGASGAAAAVLHGSARPASLRRQASAASAIRATASASSTDSHRRVSCGGHRCPLQVVRGVPGAGRRPRAPRPGLASPALSSVATRARL